MALALAIVLDVAVFLVATGAGAGLELAQVLSFAAAVAGGGAMLRSAPRVRGAAVAAPGGAAWVVVVLLAFAMHGGVLHLLAATLPVPLILAIAAAALCAGGAILLALRFLPGAVPPEVRLSVPQWAAIACLVGGYLLAIRLVYLPQLQLLPEEAYYWNFARHPALGYLDHPPLAAWLIAVATLLGQTEFAVRLPAVACALVTLVFAWRFGREAGGPSTGWRTVLLAASLPYFFLAGFIMTPDAPLMAAWAAALFYLRRALLAGDGPAWLGAGVAIGAGMLSKYTMSLVPLAVLAFVLLDRRLVRTLRSPWPWAGAAVALVLFSPVLVWNAQHDWASFAFQGTRRLEPTQPSFELHLFLGYVVLTLTPWGVAGLLRGWMREARNEGGGADGAGAAGALSKDARRFCAVFTVVPLLPLAVSSVWTETKPHWLGPIWLAALPLIAVTLESSDAGRGTVTRLDRRLAASWPALLHALMILYAVVFLYHAVYGLFGMRTHHRFVETDWRQLRAQVQTIEDATVRETGRRPAVVGLDKHYLASELAFYDPRGDGDRDTASRSVLQLGDALMYGFWFAPRDFAGRDLVLVSCDREMLDHPRLASQARQLGPVHPLAAGRDARPRTCYARVLYGFSPAEVSSARR